MKKGILEKLGFLLCMAIFGVLGPVVRGIHLPTLVISYYRALIGAVTLLGFVLLTRRHYDKSEVRQLLVPMAISGVLLAFDWAGLFAAYQYTSVATATLCYYLEPMMVLVGAWIWFGERLKLKHGICILVAFFGMALVSGVVENGLPTVAEFRGVLLALMGALAYTFIVLLNKKYTAGDALLRTTIQLVACTFAMTPYILLTEETENLKPDLQSFLLLLLLGVVITGVVYILYFDLIAKIPSRTVAFFSYADPVVAVLLSVFVLHEAMSVYGLVGAVLIIGAAVVSELV